MNLWLTESKLLRTAMACNNIAIAYRELGNYEMEEYWRHKAIKTNPKFVKAYFGLSGTYWRLGKNKEALKAIKKAIELNPSYPDVTRSLNMIKKSFEGELKFKQQQKEIDISEHID